MTKTELLGVFQTSLNTCTLAYASMVLWAYEDTTEYFDKLYEALDIPKPHDDVLALVNNTASMRIAMETLYDTAHRAALKDLFELTKSYFEATGQLALLRSQPWYQFWRMLRNCLSHGFVLRFNEYDKGLLPVVWNGTTLDASLDGKTLTHGLLSREKLRELLEAVFGFIRQSAA